MALWLLIYSMTFRFTLLLKSVFNGSNYQGTGCLWRLTRDGMACLEIQTPKSRSLIPKPNPKLKHMNVRIFSWELLMRCKNAPCVQTMSWQSSALSEAIGGWPKNHAVTMVNDTQGCTHALVQVLSGTVTNDGLCATVTEKWKFLHASSHSDKRASWAAPNTGCILHWCCRTRNGLLSDHSTPVSLFHADEWFCSSHGEDQSSAEQCSKSHVFWWCIKQQSW